VIFMGRFSPLAASCHFLSFFQFLSRNSDSTNKVEVWIRVGLKMLNEEIYAFLIDKTRDGIAVIQDSEFKLANPRLREITGYSEEELASLSFRALFGTAETESLRECFRQGAGAKEDSSPVVVSLRRKKGQNIFVEISSGKISFEGKAAEIIVIRDITSRKDIEDELHRMVEKLRKAMGATLRAINLTVEMRDPYTAGHQRRVADLARAIADQLGIRKDQVDTIRMAASIHDIGKVSIPSDILSKPGRLNESEFSLVKTHPRIGFDILKQIDFPGPVALTVLEHHERLDGSGYPQGLRGDGIILEARILGVADVVETMVSHRPYRSALDIEQALGEIARNRGVLYDPEVVDACLSLFRGEMYAFK